MLMSVPQQRASGGCKICQYPDPDIRLCCGCLLHARCMPLNLVLASSDGQLRAVQKTECQPCPVCQGPVSEIVLFPMLADCIEAAVLARKEAARKKKEPAFDSAQLESSYLLLTHSSACNRTEGDYPFLRTGRWSEEERIFVDFLMNAFDNGILPIPEGVRLNDFLSDLLLCKNSRLTKKMKNAKLSARSYKFNPGHSVGLDVGMLSLLEARFLASVSSEATKLELRFNMTRAWRSHFSNMCLQASSDLLNASEWVANIEYLEQRAAQAEELIRKSRRQRMGLALRADVKAASAAPAESSSGVFISGLSVNNFKPSVSMVRSESSVSAGVVSADGDTSKVGDTTEGDNVKTVKTTTEQQPQTNEGYDEDFSSVLDCFLLDHRPSQPNACLHRTSSGPFLEEIVGLMETSDLPFQHVDIWVPSYAPSGSSVANELRLCHAGHGTRSDVDASLYSRLFEYGEYSSKFSFAPGVGLPGRLYTTGKPSWERSVDEADIKCFERAGGAKVYGVKTALGLPLATSVIGKSVLVLYSTEDLTEDASVIDKCLASLEEYVPEPKWKLVVEMGSSSSPRLGPASAPAVQQPSQLPPLVTSFNYAGRERSPSIGSASSILSGFSNSSKHHPGSMHAYIPPTKSTGSLSQCQYSSSGSVSPSPISEDQLIANLLGEHMPLADLSSTGEPVSPSDSRSTLLHFFMSLRLALLRSVDRRTPEDNEALITIRKSYRGYSADKRRTNQELAMLVVRDWQFLQQTASEMKPAAVKTSGHICHVMGRPNINTLSTTGQPVGMPSALGLPDLRRPSVEISSAPVEKKRKYSEDMMSDVDLNLIGNL